MHKYFGFLFIFLVISCAPPTTRKIIEPEKVEKEVSFEAPVKPETVYIETAKIDTVVMVKEIPILTEVFKVQIGAFKEKTNANRIYTSLKGIFGDLVYVENIPPYWKVRIGRYRNKEEATKKRDELRRQGFVDAFVVK